MIEAVNSIVPRIGEPDIDESYIRRCDSVVLRTLLVDRTLTQLNGGTVETRVKPCPGCKSGDAKKHNGVRCRVMDWEVGRPVLFMPPFEFKPIEEEEQK